MSDFNYAKYNSEGVIQDPSDAYANSGFVISFYHLISNTTLKFKAYITNFNESYNSDFAAEAVFGRADPIYAFRSTTRQIALTFRIPASSTGEAYENLAKAQKLVQFLYPAYVDDSNALTIAQTPLTRLKIMNLVGNMAGENLPDAGQSFSTIYSSYGPSSEAEKGLLGAIQNVTIMHNVENDEIGVFEIANGTILPKMIEVQLSFAPIHEHSIGWKEDGTFTEPAFPYAASLEGFDAFGDLMSTLDEVGEILEDTGISNTANLDEVESNIADIRQSFIETYGTGE
jgi:hypothetical protein